MDGRCASSVLCRPGAHRPCTVSMKLLWLGMTVTDRLIGLDLHDLHDLRNRLIVFVHELLKVLRANGVSVFSLPFLYSKG